MNNYAIIILSALILEFLLNLVADILNLKALGGILPEEFQSIYDADAYKKSQSYTRVKIRMGIIMSIFNLCVVLVFWFLGGFNQLDIFIRSWSLHHIWNGLIYIGILLLIRFILSIPFSLYSTFVIEEKFGFNRTTPLLYITDMLKAMALTLILGGPLLAGLLAFFQYAGRWAWAYAWGATTLFTLIIQFFAPSVILPLFNKFQPLESGELLEKITAYVHHVRYRISGIYLMDGSKRSTKSNAFFTGFGKHKRIALFDTLLDKHTTSEIVTILAHEIGHYKKHHIIIGMIIQILHLGILFFLISIFLTQQALFDAFYMQHSSIYTGFLFFGLLYTPVDFILSIIMNKISRYHEYTADRFAIETTQDPESFIAGLKNLSRHNMVNLKPHPFYVMMNYSHPPILKRIEAIRQLKINRSSHSES
jgi:STE24 endopeptidase